VSRGELAHLLLSAARGNRRPAVEAFARRLPPPRTISSRLGNGPYLSRYYIAGRVRDDDEHPLVRSLERRKVVFATEHYGTYLHHFHRGDEELELHSHPWTWAASLILVGGYIEERRHGDRVKRRAYLPGQVSFIRSSTFHRVSLIEEDAWTLFVTGPKVEPDTWFFWNRVSGQETEWRTFIRTLRAGTDRPWDGRGERDRT
jgi:hypothetical protein